MKLCRQPLASAVACVAVAVVLGNDDMQTVNARTRIVEEEDAESPAQKPTPLTSAPLQRLLDETCVKRFKALCEEGKDAFCNYETAVARKGRGSETQTDDQWRCYDDRFLGTDSSNVQCTDNCGTLFHCKGSINPSTSVHTTMKDLETELVNRVPEFCSPQQKTLNEYCNNLREGWVARRGVLTSSAEDQEWRCFDVAKLEYHLQSQCVDNCSRLRHCPGGREGPDRRNLTENDDYASIPEARSLIASGDPPCEAALVCISTPKNPAKCVSEGEVAEALEEEAEQETKERREVEKEEQRKVAAASVAPPQSEASDSPRPPQDIHSVYPQLETPTEEELGVLGTAETKLQSLQGLLNARCAEEFNYLCTSENLAPFCTQPVVARKDYGVYTGFEGSIWRCISFANLDQERKSICVDNCGAEYVCDGGIEPTEVVHAQWSALGKLVTQRKNDRCKRPGAEEGNEGYRKEYTV
ncbi:unnamed protein product [Neospora caninum Liverpool]|uniref:NcMCP5, putative n=1 Tax=Neospora caninum (strain Liverpool) TaxID=572307 RepID=F0VRA2_NEOCL|nr:uncharacterized protein NCLIV_066750 [Neospora caninum Liverpool]CBZ56250.1 unnamed protein product [Neospora caninum Liverpool]CEL71012.1 TPA: NcMCP5, putative [Neospora caninum Liverpool]|eukprot:XP_003886275.1 uncharacterized protein NCLIV_066750 [Neospora caninum Liverpool]